MKHASWVSDTCRKCKVIDLKEFPNTHEMCGLISGGKQWTCKSGAVKVNLWTRFFLWRRIAPGGAPISIVWGYKDWALNWWGRFKINLKYDINHGRFPKGFLRRNGFINGLCYSPLFYWRIYCGKVGWRYTWMWSALSWLYLLVAVIFVVAWVIL